jgi:hypothetical protein
MPRPLRWKTRCFWKRGTRVGGNDVRRRACPEWPRQPSPPIHVGAGNSKRPSKEATLAQHSKARTRAEAQFKQVQKPQPATQPTTKGGQATADYLAEGHAVRAKTAQLRELRLAKEGAATVTKKSSR